jgi:hypothetical protein
MKQAVRRGAYFLVGLLASTLACSGQKNMDQRPPPLDPAQAEREARMLVAKLLAQVPDGSATNTGLVRIRDAEGNEREFPVRFEVTLTATNWVNSYETLPSAGASGGLRLEISHFRDQPNRYDLFSPATAGATNTVPEPRRLTPAQIMAPFAGSDFWIADLGLEFLHWPQQRLSQKNTVRHTKACHVLESINPAPVAGGYSKVVSWIIIDGPPGIAHADAYDAKGERFKSFDPTSFDRAKGQLEEMELRNLKTDSRTLIKYNLDRN